MEHITIKKLTTPFVPLASAFTTFELIKVEAGQKDVHAVGYKAIKDYNKDGLMLNKGDYIMPVNSEFTSIVVHQLPSSEVRKYTTTDGVKLTTKVITYRMCNFNEVFIKIGNKFVKSEYSDIVSLFDNSLSIVIKSLKWEE